MAPKPATTPSRQAKNASARGPGRPKKSTSTPARSASSRAPLPAAVLKPAESEPWDPNDAILNDVDGCIGRIHVLMEPYFPCIKDYRLVGDVHALVGVMAECHLEIVSSFAQLLIY